MNRQLLSEWTDKQALVLHSGHLLGLFPSCSDSLRGVLTNGMVIPENSTQPELAARVPGAVVVDALAADLDGVWMHVRIIVIAVIGEPSESVCVELAVVAGRQTGNARTTTITRFHRDQIR